MLSDDGPVAGVTDTDGGICVFFDDGDANNGSPNVFSSFAADKPNTISSNFLLRFSFPPISGGSSTGVGYIKILKCLVRFVGCFFFKSINCY